MLLNGQGFLLEVMPDLTGRELKQLIKEKLGKDQLMATSIEVVFGDCKLLDDDKLADVGVSAESQMTIVLKENIARCSHQYQLVGCVREFDVESLMVVEVPKDVSQISGA